MESRDVAFSTSGMSLANCLVASLGETLESEGWPFGWLWFGFCDDGASSGCCMIMLLLLQKSRVVAADIRVGDEDHVSCRVAIYVGLDRLPRCTLSYAVDPASWKCRQDCQVGSRNRRVWSWEVCRRDLTQGGRLTGLLHGHTGLVYIDYMDQTTGALRGPGRSELCLARTTYGSCIEEPKICCTASHICELQEPSTGKQERKLSDRVFRGA
jgi:hypothetical protein